jgi:hypothetical protein
MKWTLPFFKRLDAPKVEALFDQLRGMRLVRGATPVGPLTPRPGYSGIVFRRAVAMRPDRCGP